MLNWTKAFLTGRSQKVSVNGVHSSPIHVTSGVPQGSVLGQTLFLLYINDINNQVNSTVRLFADDSLLYRPIWSLKDHEILQKDLETLSAWANKWQMSFNVSKCKVLSLTKKKLPSRFTYIMDGEPLELVSSHPFLGVTLASNLRWSEHCRNISNSATRVLNTVRRTLHPCTLGWREEKAYKALVRPKLEYSAPAWNPYTKQDVSRIEQVQRNAARFVTGDYASQSVSKIVHSLGWKSLEHRRRLASIVFFHKIFHSHLKINLPHPMSVTSRNSSHLIQPSTRTDAFKYSFYPRSIRLLNMLPSELRLLKDPDKFQANCHVVVCSLSPPPYVLYL